MAGEILIEPGGRQLWLQYEEQGYRLDLAALLAQEGYAALRLPRVWRQGQLREDGSLIWPGGAVLCPEQWQGCVIAQPQGDDYYRPLRPYLRYHEPVLWLRPEPISELDICRLLHCKSHQLERAAVALSAPVHLVRARLSDAAALLAEVVGPTALLPVLRRNWPVAQRMGDIRLTTMQDCLLLGRPDLVERSLVHLCLEVV